MNEDRFVRRVGIDRIGRHLLLLGGMIWSLETVEAAGIMAGFAERDVSPEIGMERPGGFVKDFHRTFHDPCKVRVALFSDGGKNVVLVGVDAVQLPRDLMLRARDRIARTTDIRPEEIMIGASHSHTSGPTGILLPGQFDTASEQVRKLAYEESTLADADYLETVTQGIVDGVRHARAARVPAQLGFGFGHEDTISFNRRYRMKNGQIWTNPGQMNPDIVDYAGPIDPQVGVIGAWDLEGNLLGTAVNFGTHPTGLPRGISANWIYYLEKTIQGATGTNVPVVFMLGPSGNINARNSLDPYEQDLAPWASKAGARIGAEAIKVLYSVPRTTDVTLDGRHRVWHIARRTSSAETLEKAHAILARGKPDPRAPSMTEWIFAKETLLLQHLIETEPQGVEVEVQALQVGPAVLVSSPAEYFVEYGLQIKEASRFPFTFAVALANGAAGYVPLESDFGPSGGGYETRLTADTNLEITAGRQFADTGIALANAMTPDPAPQLPPLKKAGEPWSYGNVPPGRN